MEYAIILIGAMLGGGLVILWEIRNAVIGCRTELSSINLELETFRRQQDAANSQG